MDFKIGNYLKEARQTQNLSIEGLAYLSEVNYNTIRNIESGNVENPGIHTVAKILSVLKISIVFKPNSKP